MGGDNREMCLCDTTSVVSLAKGKDENILMVYLATSLTRTRFLKW